MSKIAIIGFGEAGQAFVKGWNQQGELNVTAYDIKTDANDKAVATGKWRDFDSAGVLGCGSIRQALESADVVMSLVTADQANAVALAAAPHLPMDALFFDGNSCAPDTKKKSAQSIENAGGRYIDMAIMAPVHPTLHKTPLLLSGPHIKAAKEVIEELGLVANPVAGSVGKASAVKMTRSIMVKGLEALMLECVLAGRKAGVDDVVLDSLESTYPGLKWKELAVYMFERVLTHGVRRAAEMREVAKTVDDLNLNGTMAHATVDWHQRIGDLGLDTQGFENKNYQQLADVLLEKLGE